MPLLNFVLKCIFDHIEIIIIIILDISFYIRMKPVVGTVDEVVPGFGGTKPSVSKVPFTSDHLLEKDQGQWAYEHIPKKTCVFVVFVCPFLCFES